MREPPRLSVGVLSVGVLSVGVLSVGVLAVGVLSVGVLSVGFASTAICWCGGYFAHAKHSLSTVAPMQRG